MNEDNYLRAIQALLPPGLAWAREAGKVITRFLGGFTPELARIEARSRNLIEESDPRTTVEMLSDWEAALGLPDPCVVSEQTDVQRRMQVVAKYGAQGSQRPEYFIGLAALLGYMVTITEFDEWSVDDDVDVPFSGEEWESAWRVNAPLETLVEWTVDSNVDMPFAVWGNEALECVLRRVAPADTIVLFSYS